MKVRCSGLLSGSVLLFLALGAVATGKAQDKEAPKPDDSQTFRAGGVTLTIPSPANDLVEMGPDLRVLLDVLVPDSNRLVAAFITPEDLASLPKSGKKGLSKYCLVQVVRRAEFLEVDEATFKSVIDGASSQMGTLLDSAAKTEGDALNRRIAALGVEGKITLDKPVQLGTMFAKQNAFGLALMVPVSSGGETKNMVGGTVLLRVKNRLVIGYIFAEYKDEETADWVKKTSEDWADAVLKANGK